MEILGVKQSEFMQKYVVIKKENNRHFIVKDNEVKDNLQIHI